MLPSTKFLLYEHSLRIPMLFMGPGIKPGSSIDFLGTREWRHNHAPPLCDGPCMFLWLSDGRPLVIAQRSTLLPPFFQWRASRRQPSWMGCRSCHCWSRHLRCPKSCQRTRTRSYRARQLRGCGSSCRTAWHPFTSASHLRHDTCNIVSTLGMMPEILCARCEMTFMENDGDAM
eukprot:COSAG01_NODE_6239_length_3775_cov_1.900979_3_plen_174_part_00